MIMTMQPEDVERLGIKDTSVPLHAGLELAQVLVQIPDGDIDLLQGIAVAVIKENRVRFGDDVYKALLAEAERHETVDFGRRQQYFSALFAAAMEHDDGECVYPTAFTKMMKDPPSDQFPHIPDEQAPRES